MKHLFSGLAAAVLAGWGISAAAGDGDLVTQLGTEHVDITTHFTGEKILVFGALSKPGDIIIKVVSPREPVGLSRKVATGPFWLDGGKLMVRDAPGLVYLLSSRPLKEIVGDDERKRYGMDLDAALTQLHVVNTPAGMADWKTAFARLKRNDGHYLEEGDAVRLVGNRLFSAELALPAKIPLGEYHLDIYLARGGKIIGHQTRTLNVSQVHLERWVADAAHSHSWLFGVSFTIFSMAIGLGLGMVLRRDTDA